MTWQSLMGKPKPQPKPAIFIPDATFSIPPPKHRKRLAGSEKPQAEKM